MKRPEVTLDNYEEVYRFYRDYKPNRLATWALFGALGSFFYPRSFFAEGTKENLDRRFKLGQVTVLASEHSKGADPCNIASAVIKNRVLRPLIGNTAIPGKSNIFHDIIPQYFGVNLNPLLRYAVDALGTKPVFRPKEYGKDSRLAYTRHELLQLNVHLLENGTNVTTFAAAERNTVDPLTVQKVKSDVGHMVCRVAGDDQPAIQTLGIYYDPNDRLGMLRPTLYFGACSDQTFTNKKEVTDWLQVELQASQDGAVAASRAVFT